LPPMFFTFLTQQCELMWVGWSLNNFVVSSVGLTPAVFYMKRSFSLGLISSVAFVFSASGYLYPLIMATGMASFACPMTSSAALEISSAIAVCLTLRTYPNRPFSPLRSLMGFMPATPMATFISPILKGRP